MMNRTSTTPGAELKASQLYCEECRESRPVREELALYLANRILYHYVCRSCQSILGTRTAPGRI